MKFVKYNDDGEILFHGDVPDNMLSLQGGNVIAGEGRPETHYVDLQSLSIVAKPERPSTAHYWDCATKEWQADINAAWSEVREKRRKLLSDSDWADTVSAQSRMTPEAFAAWASYRQALRDVTSQPDPFNITWPKAP